MSSVVPGLSVLVSISSTSKQYGLYSLYDLVAVLVRARGSDLEVHCFSKYFLFWPKVVSVMFSLPPIATHFINDISLAVLQPWISFWSTQMTWNWHCINGIWMPLKFFKDNAALRSWWPQSSQGKGISLPHTTNDLSPDLAHFSILWMWDGCHCSIYLFKAAQQDNFCWVQGLL